MINYDEGAKIFKALGDSRRLSIIDMISWGEICACMILKKFKFSQPTLSHHMKLLCNSGLVNGREQGKWTYYSVNKAGIEQAIEFLSAIEINDEAIVQTDENCC